jgi:hypothetical protein
MHQKRKKLEKEIIVNIFISLILNKNSFVFLVWRDPLTMIRITNIEILGPIPGTNQSNS